MSPRVWMIVGCVTLFGFINCAPTPFLRADTADGTSADGVNAFIRDSMIGKTLETKATTKTGAGETEFHRRIQFINLARTPEAISFDAVVVVKQKNFDLDANGERLDKPPTVLHRSLVTRYSLRQLKSTDQLVGDSHQLTSSARDPIGSSKALQVSLKDNRLTLIESTPLFTDVFAAGGKFKTGAGVTTTEYSIAEGRLKAQWRELVFDVDPTTLARTPSGHDVILSGEQIEGLF